MVTRVPHAAWLALWAAVTAAACGRSTPGGDEVRDGFQLETIDSAGPRDPWGKAVGDIDGDALPDLVVGGHEPPVVPLWRRALGRLGIVERVERSGELVWYQNPTWQRHVVATDLPVRTDVEVADVNADGRNDLVVLADQGLLWLANPTWERFVIDTRRFHDVEVADLDGDADLDIVARNQGFNRGDGNRLYVYRQDSPAQWNSQSFDIPQGEGLHVTDMDGDRRPDVVVNQVWLQNLGAIDGAWTWRRHDYAGAWTWADVFIDTGDFDADGRRDIVLAPAEMEGQRYRLSWFSAPESPEAPWQEHVVEADVEAVRHFVAARDMNGDEALDVVTAEMTQGTDPDEITVYVNTGNGTQWSKQLVATTGSHAMRAVDIDNDFDVDLFGANWHVEDEDADYPVSLWRNRSRGASGWTRHVIDDARPKQAAFVLAADLDGDTFRDILTGPVWYRNPGTPSGRWQRHAFGEGANNVVAARDLDRDGRLDVIASGWPGERYVPDPLWDRILRKLRLKPVSPEGRGDRFVWGRNDGAGSFVIRDNIAPARGDFPHGVAFATGGGAARLVLSWHEAGQGIQALTIPADPTRTQWSWERLSDVSQDEAVSAADVDRDGDEDLVLGTRWLRNDGAGVWTPFTLHDTGASPDRHVVVDLDRDGRLDVVVGFEAISRPGPLAWFAQGEDPTQPWTPHLVDDVVGPMSLDVADLDRDGDVDLIVGEHNLAHPGNARLLWYENASGDGSSWRGHLIAVGDEHHVGAQAVDADNDGDLDIVSIGWGHDRVLLYENPGRETAVTPAR